MHVLFWYAIKGLFYFWTEILLAGELYGIFQQSDITVILSRLAYVKFSSVNQLISVIQSKKLFRNKYSHTSGSDYCNLQ